MPATATKPAATASKRKSPTSALKPAQVLAYLQANPTFFEKHKATLVQSAAPTKKGKGAGRVTGTILSLHAAQAQRVTNEAENLKIRQQQLISTARGNAEVADSIFTAVLGLIACRTLPDLRKYLQNTLADDLQLDAIRLFKLGNEETATTLTADQILALCPQPMVLGPLNAAQHRILFGPKTNNLKSVCVMALAGTDDTLHGLLAMGSSNATRFHAGQATTLADFLRRATAQVLAHAS